MMKKLFLVLTLLPIFLFSQNGLVKWYNANFTPSILENHISASSITTKGVSLTNETWDENVFYNFGNGWPADTAINNEKYIQFKVSPEEGYKIAMGTFSFNGRTQGSTPFMQVRFSKTESFIASTALQAKTTVSANYSTYNLQFPSNTVIHSGEALYVRIYIYNTYNNFHLQHNLSGTIAPNITGTVSLENPVKPVTNNDRTGTAKNTIVTIDLLKNDDYQSSGPLSAISIIKAPRNGSVKINGLNNVTYTPNRDYTGADVFYYTLKNDVGVSNVSKVEVQVVDGHEEVLLRWNKSDYAAKSYNAGVSGAFLIGVGEKLSVTKYNNQVENFFFSISGLPTPKEFNGNLDVNKYLQATITTDSDHTAYLKSFNLSYKGQSDQVERIGNITIRYSKTADFSGQIFTIANNEPYFNQSISKGFVFPEGVILYPNEKLYIRIYTYNTNNIFFIDAIQNGDVGPAITGIVSAYVPTPEPCLQTSTWTGKSWEGGLPDLDKKAVITANYNTAINGEFSACTLTATNNAVITVATNTAIIIENEITVHAGSSVVVKNEANLIQHSDAAINTGIITIEKNANLKRLDYIYWGSPVKNQELKKFSPGTLDNRFYTYNEANDFFEVINPKNTTFGFNSTGFESAAKGYAIRASNNYPVGVVGAPSPIQKFTGVFTGVPNNGVISFPLQYQTTSGSYVGHGYNLVANPYPSNINFDLLFEDNQDLIDGTAYFWTNINPNPPMQGSGYPKEGSINNYATLNGSGSLPATQGIAMGLESKKPSTIIEIGQGFIVRALKPGDLVFNNSYRTTESEGVFFNRQNSEKTKPVLDRFWLELKTPLDVVTTALIAYVQHATNGFEDRYDAQLLNLGSDALFTKVAHHQLGIQGRKFPLQSTDVVSLGMNHYEDGEYTLSIGKKEGIFADGQPVYIKDNQTGTVVKLSDQDYTFTALKGLHEDRFEIVYQNDIVLGTNTASKDEVVVYRDGSDFVVKSVVTAITSLELYDTAGRLVYKVQPNSKEVIVNAAMLTNGMYVLKINQNGKVFSKKIMK